MHLKFNRHNLAPKAHHSHEKIHSLYGSCRPVFLLMVNELCLNFSKQNHSNLIAFYMGIGKRLSIFEHARNVQDC